jgi:hypothetical protein
MQQELDYGLLFWGREVLLTFRFRTQRLSAPSTVVEGRAWDACVIGEGAVRIRHACRSLLCEYQAGWIHRRNTTRGWTSVAFGTLTTPSDGQMEQ